MPSMPPSFRPIAAPAREERIASDRARGSAASRGYGRRWRVAARAFLAQHPICMCGDDNCGRLATEVDHIRPHRGNERLFWDRENWQALTKECHAAKTGRGE